MSLLHHGSQKIETGRLLLRPVLAADAPDLFTGCLSDPQVTRYISIPTHSAMMDTAALLMKAVESYGRRDFYYWAIVPKAGKRVAGIMLAFNVDERSHKCEVGYYLRRDMWGRGFMEEALRATVDFLFQKVGFMRLEARCNVANNGSMRVLEKCGFVYEGCMRKGFLSNKDGYVDSNFYGLLQEDWEKERSLS